jgi:hypothetical protein
MDLSSSSSQSSLSWRTTVDANLHDDSSLFFVDNTPRFFVMVPFKVEAMLLGAIRNSIGGEMSETTFFAMNIL